VEAGIILKFGMSSSCTTTKASHVSYFGRNDKVQKSAAYEQGGPRLYGWAIFVLKRKPDRTFPAGEYSQKTSVEPVRTFPPGNVTGPEQCLMPHPTKCDFAHATCRRIVKWRKRAEQ